MYTVKCRVEEASNLLKAGDNVKALELYLELKREIAKADEEDE
jgi:hypothetical protein